MFKHEGQWLPAYSVCGTGSGGRCLIFFPFQLLEMGIKCPYATGSALAAPPPGPRFVDCVDNFRSILLCKVPCSILILTMAPFPYLAPPSLRESRSRSSVASVVFGIRRGGRREVAYFFSAPGGGVSTLNYHRAWPRPSVTDPFERHRVTIFGVNLHHKVPCSIFNATVALWRAHAEKKSCQFSSLQEL